MNARQEPVAIGMAVAVLFVSLLESKLGTVLADDVVTALEILVVAVVGWAVRARVQPLANPLEVH